ncbi:hypothetical protein ABH926_005547 [Catenulispora sp. GP43]|uniref:hypothetical protein n=1 Tax=Catenulispora sp. GP43 TaxID=3156263 RepID=UPI0035154078
MTKVIIAAANPTTDEVDATNFIAQSSRFSGSKAVVLQGAQGGRGASGGDTFDVLVSNRTLDPPTTGIDAWWATERKDTSDRVATIDIYTPTSSPSKQAASGMITNKLSSQAQWVCVNVSKVRSAAWLPALKAEFANKNVIFTN